MNIEEAIEILKNSKKLYLKEKIDSDILEEAIETLLTAYEKEKEELKENKKFLEKNEIEYIRDRTEDEVNIKWQDKIKAKVIEVKNRTVKDEFITASQGKLNTVIDMESLLEKE